MLIFKKKGFKIKKLFIGLIAFYILSCIIYFLSGKLITYLPSYSFYNISTLLANEFKNKEVIKIISIERTSQAYIFTKEKDFHIVSIRDMKLLHHSTLPITEDIKSIYCNELECKILTNNSLLKMDIIHRSNNKKDIIFTSLKINKKEKNLNEVYFCKNYSKFYQKNEGYIIKFYEKGYKGQCKERASFLNLYDIKDLAVDNELFYTIYEHKKMLYFSIVMVN